MTPERIAELDYAKEYRILKSQYDRLDGLSAIQDETIKSLGERLNRYRAALERIRERTCYLSSLEARDVSLIVEETLNGRNS